MSSIGVMSRYTIIIPSEGGGQHDRQYHTEHSRSKHTPLFYVIASEAKRYAGMLSLNCFTTPARFIVSNVVFSINTGNVACRDGGSAPGIVQ